MKDKISVAFVQFDIEADPFEAEVVEGNYEKACELIEDAAKTAKDLIILPDEIVGAYAYGPMNIPMEFENEYMDKIREKAKEHSIYIAGAVLAKQDYITSYSRGFLINRQGNVVFEQNRNNVLKEEERFVIKNDDEIEIYEADFGKIAFLVGIDLLNPFQSVALMPKEVDIIISPNMYYGKNGRDSYPCNFFISSAKSRAMEHQAFVLLSNSTGMEYHSEEKIIGNSVVVYPNGACDFAGDGEGVYNFVLNLDALDDDYMSVYKLNK